MADAQGLLEGLIAPKSNISYVCALTSIIHLWRNSPVCFLEEHRVCEFDVVFYQIGSTHIQISFGEGFSIPFQHFFCFILQISGQSSKPERSINFNIQERSSSSSELDRSDSSVFFFLYAGV